MRNFSMSVNSAAVLRLMGRGAGPPPAAARGRGTARGRDGRQPVEKDMLKRRDRGETNSAEQNLRTRGMSSGPSAEEIARPVRNFSTLSGRGRGESSFYQRSFDEVEVGFGRGAREINRSQSWEERAGERRYEKPGRREVARLNFEETTPGPAKKHDLARADIENWRATRDDPNGERWRQNQMESPGLCCLHWLCSISNSCFVSF
uniref:Uncharacterized protein n=1 Tax=Eptatretus burgeri TaxID=7764 RepID=A0A8C4QXY6_EPTBU